MKPHSLYIIFFILLITSLSISANDVGIDMPGAQDVSWEMHEGVATAIKLCVSSSEGRTKNLIRVFVKNESQFSRKVIFGTDDPGFKILILSSGKSWKPLRDKVSTVVSAASAEIKPGETLLHNIDLSSEEASLIKTHPIKFEILIFDPQTKEKSIFTTQSQQLLPSSS